MFVIFCKQIRLFTLVRFGTCARPNLCFAAQPIKNRKQKVESQKKNGLSSFFVLKFVKFRVFKEERHTIKA